jgi:hypothetical protein
MNTGPLPTLSYPLAGGRRYMANGQLPWLTPFSQQDAPGFSWRFEITKFMKREISLTSFLCFHPFVLS